MKIMGIDPSLAYTAVGVVEIDKGPAWFNQQMFVIKTKPADFKHRIERVTHMHDRLKEIIGNASKPDIAFVEGYSYGTTNHRAESIAEWGGLIRHLLFSFGIPIIEVPPSVLKKFVAGKGNAEKSVMLREVFRKWKYDAKSDNEADAFGLVQLGIAYHTQVVQPKTIIEMFEKLEVMR